MGLRFYYVYNLCVNFSMNNFAPLSGSVPRLRFSSMDTVLWYNTRGQLTHVCPKEKRNIKAYLENSGVKVLPPYVLDRRYRCRGVVVILI